MQAHGTPERPSTKCSILAVVGGFSPHYYLLLTCICTNIIIFLVCTRAFIGSNELQYLHCPLNIWRIVSCSDVDPPYWKTFYARPLPRVSFGDVTGN